MQQVLTLLPSCPYLHVLKVGFVGLEDEVEERRERKKRHSFVRSVNSPESSGQAGSEDQGSSPAPCSRKKEEKHKLPAC